MEVIGIVLMVAMAFLCIRMMRGTMGGCCMVGRRSSKPSMDVSELRRELHEVRNWTRMLRRGTRGM